MIWDYYVLLRISPCLKTTFWKSLSCLRQRGLQIVFQDQLKPWYENHDCVDLTVLKVFFNIFSTCYKTGQESPPCHTRKGLKKCRPGLQTSWTTQNILEQVRPVEAEPCPQTQDLAFWHQGADVRSVEFCRLRGGTSMDWTCWRTSHGCTTALWARQSGGQANTLSTLSHSSDHSWAGFVEGRAHCTTQSIYKVFLH